MSTLSDHRQTAEWFRKRFAECKTVVRVGTPAWLRLPDDEKLDAVIVAAWAHWAAQVIDDLEHADERQAELTRLMRGARDANDQADRARRQRAGAGQPWPCDAVIERRLASRTTLPPERTS